MDNTTRVNSLDLFRVLSAIGTGTPEEWILLRRSANESGSPLQSLIAASNVAVQSGVIGTDGMDVTASLALDNARLRQMLGEATNRGMPYRDDGEFQCNAVHPCIDYMRDSVDMMRDKLERRKRLSPASVDMVPVPRDALSKVVAALAHSDAEYVLRERAGMAMGHCAGAELKRALSAHIVGGVK